MYEKLRSVIVIGGLKNYGSDVTAVIHVGTKKICTVQIPTIHGLSILRGTHTFPVSQSKLEAA
jgi:hypothetical protein